MTTFCIDFYIYESYLSTNTAIREHCNLWRNFYDVQDNWNNIQVFKQYIMLLSGSDYIGTKVVWLDWVLGPEAI
jgi:hypothetical protein